MRDAMSGQGGEGVRFKSVLTVEDIYGTEPISFVVDLSDVAPHRAVVCIDSDPENLQRIILEVIAERSVKEAVAS
jgi:hypothetical protein